MGEAYVLIVLHRSTCLMRIDLSIFAKNVDNTILHFEGYVLNASIVTTVSDENKVTKNTEEGSSADQVALLVNQKNNHVFLSTPVVLENEKC